MKTFRPQNCQFERTINHSKGKQNNVFVDNRAQSYQLKEFKNNLPLDVTLLQMVRMHFNSKIKNGAAAIREKEKKAFDLAHRLSYRDIESLVWEYYKYPVKLKRLIKALTIPRRKYGIFPRGYKGYYNKVIAQGIQKVDIIISLLNSSPFNLRPGIPSVNRSIGAAPDLHHKSNDPARPLTPQSAALEPFAIESDPGKSSDFLLGRKAKEAEEMLTKPFLGF